VINHAGGYERSLATARRLSTSAAAWAAIDVLVNKRREQTSPGELKISLLTMVKEQLQNTISYVYSLTKATLPHRRSRGGEEHH